MVKIVGADSCDHTTCPGIKPVPVGYFGGWLCVCHCHKEKAMTDQPCKICNDPANPFIGRCPHKTDQPLPLKPSTDHEIQSCPFCGERQLEIYSFNQDGQGAFEETHGVRCLNCSPERASVIEWNRAACWKLLAEKEVETKAPNELLHQTHKDLDEAKAKIQEQAETVRILTEALEGLEDTQDHEDWCGHGKAGCVMCEVIRKCLQALDRVRKKS